MSRVVIYKVHRCDHDWKNCCAQHTFCIRACLQRSCRAWSICETLSTMLTHLRMRFCPLIHGTIHLLACFCASCFILRNPYNLSARSLAASFISAVTKFGAHQVLRAAGPGTNACSVPRQLDISIRKRNPDIVVGVQHFSRVNVDIGPKFSGELHTRRVCDKVHKIVSSWVCALQRQNCARVLRRACCEHWHNEPCPYLQPPQTAYQVVVYQVLIGEVPLTHRSYLHALHTVRCARCCNDQMFCCH